MSFTVEASAIIARPREEVFAYLESHDDWRGPAVQEVRRLDPGQPAVGSRYQNVWRSRGRTFTVVNEVTVREPPHRLSWRQVGGSAPVQVIEGNYLLEDVIAGTRFTIRTTYQPRGPARLVAPLLRSIITRTVHRQVENAKAAIEAE